MLAVFVTYLRRSVPSVPHRRGGCPHPPETRHVSNPYQTMPVGTPLPRRPKRLRQTEGITHRHSPQFYDGFFAPFPSIEAPPFRTPRERCPYENPAGFFRDSFAPKHRNVAGQCGHWPLRLCCRFFRDSSAPKHRNVAGQCGHWPLRLRCRVFP